MPGTHMVWSNTRNVLLETRVSILETRLNLLEIELTNLRKLLDDQTDPKGKSPLQLEEDTNLVFIKTPSIYNMGKSVDI